MTEKQTSELRLKTEAGIDARFRIEGEIGRGAMGTVYKAVQSGLERTVALKVMRETLASDTQGRARFQREAQVISALSHPNIVKVYAVGIGEDERPFYAMEFLQGITLHDLNQERKCDKETFLRIFSQCCEALRHLHENGVVHRDIKPRNIMIEDESGRKTVKLVDFGIAKLIEPDVDDQRITKTGSIVGSPRYISPEACAAKQLDGRADIYALGCVMYETLTGKPPFDDTMATRLMTKHLMEPPPKIVPTACLFEMPQGLDHVIYKCLAKDPEERYQHAGELKRDLDKLLAGEPISVTLPQFEVTAAHAQLPGATANAPKPKILAIAATVVLVLFSATLLGYASYKIPRHFKYVENLARYDAVRFCDNGEEHVKMRDVLNASIAFDGAYNKLKSAGVNDVQLADVALRLSKVLSGDVSSATDEAAREKGLNTVRAAQLAVEAFEIYSKAPQTNRKAIDSAIFAAQLFSEQKDYVHAAQYYEIALNELTKQRASAEELSLVLQGLARSKSQAGDKAYASDCYRRLIEMHKQQNSAPDIVKRDLVSWAQLLRDMGRDADARELEIEAGQLKIQAAKAK